MSSRSSSRGRRGLQSWTQRWITSSASGIESLQKLSPLSSFDPSIPWTFLAFHFPNFVPSWRSSLVLTPLVTNIVNLGQFSRDHCWLMSSAAFNLNESRLTLVEPVIMAALYSSQGTRYSTWYQPGTVLLRSYSSWSYLPLTWSTCRRDG